jgi:hypothetical protein
MKPTKEDIKSMWDQIYFACNEKFTNVQRKSCQKFISCIEKSWITDEILHRCTHINVCPIQYGEAKLCLSKEKILIESGHIRDVSVTSLSKVISDVSVDSLSKVTSGGSPSKPTFNTPANYSQNSVSDAPTGDSQRSVSEVPIGDSLVNGASNTTSTNSTFAPMAASSDPLFSALPSATSRPDDPSFYMDRRGSRMASNLRDPDFSFVIKNLPRDISGAELDEECLSKYEIDSINFLTPRNEVAVVTFKSTDEKNRAMSELTDSMLRGRTIIVVPPNIR